MAKINYIPILLLVLVFGCTPPQSFVASTPKTSFLKQKGDFNASVGLGAETKLASHIFDFNVFWSPISHVGIRSQLTTKGYSHRLQKLRYYDIGLIYYTELGTNSRLEVTGGYGQGYVTSGYEYYSSNTNDHPTITVTPVYRRYYSDNAYQKWYLSPAFVFDFKNEPIEFSLGLQSQYIDFNRYLYVKHESWQYNEPFSAFILDPFMNYRYRKGRFGFNTSLSYSLPINGPSSPDLRHPVYNRLVFGFGINFILPKGNDDRSTD